MLIQFFVPHGPMEKISVGLGDGLASNTWQAITWTINDQAMALKPKYSGRIKSIP